MSLFNSSEMRLANATVLRVIEGFGAGSLVMHTAKILRLSEDLPIVVGVVDTMENIDSFMYVAGDFVETAGCGGMMTEAWAHVIRYTSGR